VTDRLQLDGCTNHAACIRDEIRDDPHAPFVQRLLGRRGHGDVGTLQHQSGFQSMDIVVPDNVGARRCNPDVAIDVDYRFSRQESTGSMVRKSRAASLQFDECVDV
jgi:hypothetical protein